MVLRPARLHGKGAAGALLAVEAVADGNAHRLSSDGRLELTAAARSGSAGHFAAFFSASRTSESSEASGPSSSWAALTAALASAGLNPRLPSAESASAAAPPRRAGAAPPTPVTPSLPWSSLAIRAASFGPTPFARP